MNLNIRSEDELTGIINAHFGAEYTFQHCLNILDSLTLKEARGELSKDNKALLAKLEQLNEKKN